jgi:hypothetical protein
LDPLICVKQIFNFLVSSLHHFLSRTEPSDAQLRNMSGIELLQAMERCHGSIAWHCSEVSEFASVTLVMELPQALLSVLRQALAMTALRENPRT